MISVCVLGSEGMLGRIITRLLANSGYLVHEINRTGTGVLTDSPCTSYDPLSSPLQTIVEPLKNCDVAINCLGMIKHRIDPLSHRSVGEAFTINSIYARELVLLCEESDTRLLSIGSDCVFSGRHGKYTEVSPHDATDVYGISKSAGELRSPAHTIIRASFIGLKDRHRGEFLEWILNQPEGASIKGFANHYWNGLTTLQVGSALRGLIGETSFPSGVYHLTPSGVVTKAEVIRDVMNSFGRRDIALEVIETVPAVDRTLSTVKQDEVDRIWQLAGYDTAPTFKAMLQEFLAWSIESGDYEF